MFDKALLLIKLQRQKEYLVKLKVYQNMDYDNFVNDKLIQLGIERLLHLIVDSSLSVNRYLLKSLLVKQPEEKAETFIKLAELQIIDEKLAKNLKEYGKIRNLLIYLYDIVEEKTVHSSISNFLRDYPLYQRQILNYLDNLENDIN